MRYEDWDILLFPRDCKVPMKEFKVACHVVHDAVCCFVPSLASATPFQVSIHSWSAPTVSQYTRSYSKYVDTVKFEARLFIDGRLVASTALDRKSTWPHVIAHSFEFSKSGDLEFLKFPLFRQELLQQSYWSPADDLGRIKIVVSEGFPRDSLSMPIERVKNIVAFSFQHAPLDILEGSSIAWPNPSMWRRAPFTSTMSVPSYPSDDADSHAHSPRRRSSGLQHMASAYPMPAIQGAMGNPATNSNARRATHPSCGILSSLNNNQSDPFGDVNAYFEWLSSMGMGMADANTRDEAQQNPGLSRSARRTSTDISMPDYVSLNSGGQAAVPPEQSVSLSSFRQDEDSQCGSLKVPTNTPTTGGGHGSCDQEGASFSFLNHTASIPSDLASSLTNSLLNQPMPPLLQNSSFHVPTSEIKSRKENRLHQTTGPSPPALSTKSISGQDHADMRRVSQQMYIPSGASLPVCTVSSRAPSPQNQGCLEPAQRAPSRTGDSGMGVEHLSTVDASVNVAPTMMTEKGAKRIRNFTPASSRAIDEEDEPRRASPRVRLTPFADDKSTDILNK